MTTKLRGNQTDKKFDTISERTPENGVTVDGLNIKDGGIADLIASIIKPSANSTTSITITKADGSTKVMTFDTTNNRVAIGNITPSYELHVNGTIAATGLQGRSGVTGSFDDNKFNFFWNGSAAQLWVDSSNVGNINVSSDKRVKKEIEDISSSLAKVMLMKPVKFKFIDDDKYIQYGLIAQDLQDVIPDLVINTGIKRDECKDGMLRIDYNGLIAILINAIQEQQKQIDKLKENA